jgi:hypothetical protein
MLQKQLLHHLSPLVGIELQQLELQLEMELPLSKQPEQLVCFVVVFRLLHLHQQLMNLLEQKRWLEPRPTWMELELVQHLQMVSQFKLVSKL